jgi:two-component system nitrogen regulation response regulator GlnG
LRERPSDIVPLAEHFLKLSGGRQLSLPLATQKHLQSMPWPGNVRELRNAVERAQLVARSGPFLPEHFPVTPTLISKPRSKTSELENAVRDWLEVELSAGEPTDLMNRFLEVVEPVLLGDVLERVKGNRLAAAKWLGIHRATFRKKLGAHQQRHEAEG